MIIGEPISSRDLERMKELAKHNKVLLRAVALLELPERQRNELQSDVDEGFQLCDVMGLLLSCLTIIDSSRLRQRRLPTENAQGNLVISESAHGTNPSGDKLAQSLS